MCPDGDKRLLEMTERERKIEAVQIGGESGYHHFVKHVFSIAEHFPHFSSFYFLFVSMLLGKRRSGDVHKLRDMSSVFKNSFKAFPLTK